MISNRTKEHRTNEHRTKEHRTKEHRGQPAFSASMTGSQVSGALL